VSASTHAPTPRSGDVGMLQWLDAHRGTAGVAALVSCAGPTTFLSGALSVMEGPGASTVATLALTFVLYALLLWLLLLGGGYAYWRLMPNSAPAKAALALLLASAAVAAADTATAGPRQRINLEQGVVASRLTMQLYSGTFSLAMALIFFAHLRLGTAQESAATRVGAAQAAQRALRQQTAAARLKAVQARIDPQLLFDLLEEVRRCYELDAQRAEGLLDELVAFLRSALPRLSHDHSIVSREADVARACVRLRALAAATKVELVLNVDPEAARARCPPGVLLSLSDDVMRRVQGHCTLQASRIGDDCLISLSLPAQPSRQTLERVRALLADLYPTAAAVGCDGEPGDRARVTVRIPHEPA
jgi:hypothetical protein